MLRICLLEDFHMAASVCYHLDKTATRVVILLVLLQVVGELVNLLGEHRYLHFLRARVGRVHLMLFYDCLLLLAG